MAQPGQLLELTEPSPPCVQALLHDEDIVAFSLTADGELVLDHLHGLRYRGASLLEAEYDAVAEWLDEHPGAPAVKFLGWRIYLAQLQEGVIYAERAPNPLVTLEDLYRYGWLRERPETGLLHDLCRAVFIRISGVPLWAKARLALAVQNSLKESQRPLLGPGPWNEFDVEDEVWARTLASKTATGTETVVTASGHLAAQALQSGLKVIWAPHPAYVDNGSVPADWPRFELAVWRNPEGQLQVGGVPQQGPTVQPAERVRPASPLPVRPSPPSENEQAVLPDVLPEVAPDAVNPPADWGNVDLENSPGWELGEPPEPGQHVVAETTAPPAGDINDLMLEPPPGGALPTSE